MRSMLKMAAFVVLAFSFAGCASHSMMRGSVAMKIAPNKAHVCLGNGEVKIGDKVNAYRNVCPDVGVVAGHQIPRRNCTKEKIGGGTVTELLNEHYSEVTFDEGVKFNEGTIVELSK